MTIRQKLGTHDFADNKPELSQIAGPGRELLRSLKIAYIAWMSLVFTMGLLVSTVVGAAKKVEVINACVNAWSYAQMHTHFRNYGLKYEPDIVILAAMNKLSILKEFWSLLRMRKKFWLVPIVFFLLLLGAILVIGQGSALAPFIYSLF